MTDETPPKSEKEKEERHGDADRETRIAEKIGAAVIQISSEFIAFKNQFQADNKTDKGQRREYEAKELFWTKIAAVAAMLFSVLSLALSGFTLGVLNRQATIMAGQEGITEKTLPPMQSQAQAALVAAQTAQKQFELSERPWVYTEDVAIAKPLTYDVNGANIVLRFLLKNIGNSPAAATWVNLAAFLESPSRPDPVSEQKKVCDPIRNYASNVHAIGSTLFPGQQMVITQGLSISRGEITSVISYWTSRLRANNQKVGLIPFMPVIVGCIDYRFEFKSGHHQTPFIFEILRLRPQYPGSDFVLEAYKEMPISRLKLVQWFENGGDAD